MTKEIYSKNDFLTLKFAVKNIETLVELDKILVSVRNSLNKKNKNWRTHQKPLQYKSKIKKDLSKEKCELVGYLNKLAPNNYKSIFKQISKVDLVGDLLIFMIESIFSVAIKQKMFCSIYVSLIQEIQKKHDIKNLLNSYISGYSDVQNSLTENTEDTYESFCEKNKEKIGKAGYSQFIGELYLHDMVSKSIVTNTITNLFDNLQKSENEETSENNIICICSFLNTIKSKLDNKKDINEQIKNSYKFIKVKRLKFKMMDLEDIIT